MSLTTYRQLGRARRSRPLWWTVHRPCPGASLRDVGKRKRIWRSSGSNALVEIVGSFLALVLDRVRRDAVGAQP